jgi:ethanolamine ammonia-lyase large subunit
MDVCLNTDRMLAYFDTSAHDVQGLRETYGRTPAPEFLEWGLRQGIFAKDERGTVVRGPEWGNPRQFCTSEAEFQDLLAATPAAHGFASAGPRPTNGVSRQLRIHQAVAREAVHTELHIEELRDLGTRHDLCFRVLETEARSKEAHLNSPAPGARLSAASRAVLRPEHCQVQLVVSDGLSAEAVHHNLPDLLPVLIDGLTNLGVKLGTPILVRYGRVKLAEPLAKELQADLVVYLIGERPGGDALASRSLSAYLVYHLADPDAQQEAALASGNPRIRFEYTVISNIYAGGLPAAEAGSVIVEKVRDCLKHKAAGNRLEELLKTAKEKALLPTA